MADGKKQPVSFDDIIKAGEPTTCAGPAQKTSITNITSRPSKAQERAARTRHLRQEPSPERSCRRKHQKGAHWGQSGQPCRREQGMPCLATDHSVAKSANNASSAQRRSLARTVPHHAMAVAPPDHHSQATTATALPTSPRNSHPNPETRTQEGHRPRMEAPEAASA